jgi:tripartite-type tricarboxylate transporter receptor subunit TctC
MQFISVREAIVITRRNCMFGLAAAATGLQAGAAWPQEFPARPVTLISALPPGASVDVILRALARAAEKHLGKPIIIENRPGAATTLGPAQMATSSADGYTLAHIGPPVFRLPFVHKTTYDPADFTYVIGIASYTIGVVVRSDAPWQTFTELLADAKAHPGKIAYGNAGVGSSGFVAMERIARQQGIKWINVPFKGGPDELNALLSGSIQVVVDPSTWAPQVKAGTFRLLATIGTARARSWPAVSTLRESGFDFAIDSPYGIAGPKGMRPEVVQILHDAFKKGLEDPDFPRTVAQFDHEPFNMSSADYRDYAMKQIAEEKRTVAELGLSQ